MEASLKQLRIVHGALLFSIVLYGFVSTHAPARPTPVATVLYAIALLSVALVITILVLRNKLLASAGKVLSNQPEDKVALARWRAAHIITWVLCEAIALYGLVLRYIGFPMSEAVFFFIAGFGLMLLFAPRRPEQ